MKTPNVLYTAIKALIKNNEGKVLLLKQSDPTISGSEQYHPPGGIIELGETIEQCIVREVKEEAGVICTVKRLVDVDEWIATRNEKVMQFVGLFYECEIVDTDFTLQESEVNAIAWIGLEDLDSYDIVEPSKSVIAKFLIS